MDIKTLTEKVQKNEEKLAKKVAFVEKNQVKLEKALKQFESVYGCKYEDFDEESFRKTCNTENYYDYDKWSAYSDLSNKIWGYQYSIKNNTKAIEEIKRVLANWQEKLAVEEKKESKRNCPIIKEFLNKWESVCHHKFMVMFDVFIKAYNKNITRRTRMEEISRCSLFSDEFRKSIRDLSDKEYYNFRDTWRFIQKYDCYKAEKFDKVITEVLAKEKIAKYDELISRVESIVGTITNADYLSISPRGELNGIIIGDKGKADVHTIDAGGYNIQCYHYRTLIHEIKD